LQIAPGVVSVQPPARYLGGAPGVVSVQPPAWHLGGAPGALSVAPRSISWYHSLK